MSNAVKVNRVPAYRQHKCGQAVVTLPDGFGKRKDFLLGPFGSEESKAAYNRITGEWQSQGRRLLKRSHASESNDISINELILAYIKHPEMTTLSASEMANIRAAMRPVHRLYGATAAADFTSSNLETVREGMIDAGLCRTRINKDVRRIKNLFKWGAKRLLIDIKVHQLLTTVDGLRCGRTRAKESKKVRPVPVEVVESTLPHLPAIVGDMARLQLLTGMRSGEVTIMRGMDIERTEGTWVYRPATHKTAHRGHVRQIVLGPKAQEIVLRNLGMSVEAYLFSPRKSIEQFRAGQRAARKSKVQPSQENRKRKKPKRSPGAKYTTASYAAAISRGIERANERMTRQASQDGKEMEPGLLLPHWHPHQLRHTCATQLRKAGGIDLARAALGHRSVNVTTEYAEIDIEAVSKAMSKLG